MIQRGNRAGLALEALTELLRGDFDRHIAPQPRIVRAIHFAHSARADGGKDFVRAEFCAGRERHIEDLLCVQDQDAVRAWITGHLSITYSNSGFGVELRFREKVADGCPTIWLHRAGIQRSKCPRHPSTRISIVGSRLH